MLGYILLCYFTSLCRGGRWQGAAPAATAGGGVTDPSAVLPFSSLRRNSRVPKMLPHRLFPNASFALWVDGKLQVL